MTPTRKFFSVWIFLILLGDYCITQLPFEKQAIFSLTLLWTVGMTWAMLATYVVYFASQQKRHGVFSHLKFINTARAEPQTAKRASPKTH